MAVRGGGGHLKQQIKNRTAAIKTTKLVSQESVTDGNNLYTVKDPRTDMSWCGSGSTSFFILLSLQMSWIFEEIKRSKKQPPVPGFRPLRKDREDSGRQLKFIISKL